MKKFLSVLLTFSFLFALSACSQEAVPFSDELSGGRNCYLDIVEIVPQSKIEEKTSDLLYCVCVLADGNYSWIKMSVNDYIHYFDSEATKDSSSLAEEKITAQRVEYENALRIYGIVSEDTNIKIYSEYKTDKILRFQNTDVNVSLKTGTRSIAAVKYSDSLFKDVKVYADVIRVEPINKIKTSYISSTMSVNSIRSILCECETDDGSVLYLSVAIEDYYEYFDSSAHISTSDFEVYDKSVAKVLEFVEPVRVYGLTGTVNGAPKDLVIEFGDVDKEHLEAAKSR